MKKLIYLSLVSCFTLLFQSCTPSNKGDDYNMKRVPVLFDTDANNELDDQHALAYLLLNTSTFDVKGVTVNATYNGGSIEEHYKEAKRVINLCAPNQTLSLLKGANGRFIDIRGNLEEISYDGIDAVNFIIEEAKKHVEQKLVIIAVGKLTNIALAIEKEPSIINNIKLVWLGSNYPENGEYNLENDIEAMNYLLSTNIPFEMAVCRYGKSSGTDAVRVDRKLINTKMPGLGPQVTEPIIGRHKGEFYNFGDYSVSLFEHAEMYGNPPSRALFDMAAVAVVKNTTWADADTIPAPIMINKEWMQIQNNSRKIIVRENFNAKLILEDFFSNMQNAK